MPACLRRLLAPALVLSLLLALPATGHAKSKTKRLQGPAKRFLAQQERVRKRLDADRSKVLAAINVKRGKLRTCAVIKNMPDDGFQQIKSFLYVVVDMAQETTQPWRSALEYAAAAYRKPSYGDSVLNRAGRVRYRYLRAILDLKPYDSCGVLDDWAAAGWPSDFEPTGAAREASSAMYNPDIQVPDEASLLRRLKKLGASSKQRSRTKSVGRQDAVYDAYDKVLRELFPRVDIQWH